MAKHLGYLEIADRLERQVLAGELRMDERLPGTIELAKQLKVSPLTIQRSLTRLAEKGMVRRVPGRGTFVTATILSNTIGLLLGGNVGDLPSPFYLASISAFQRLGAQHNMQTREYVVLNESTVFRSLTELEEDARSGRLRCIVPVYYNQQVGTWLKTHNNIPFITPPNVDTQGNVRQGVAHLLSQGYERILYLSLIARRNHSSYADELRHRELQGVAEAIAEAGADDDAVDVVDEVTTEAEAYRVCRDALDEGRCDAIFVGHDLVMRGAVMAILGSGKTVGAEVGILSHMNKGCEIFSPFPLSTMVVDPEDLAHATLRYIASSEHVLMPGANKTPGHVPATFHFDESTRRSAASGRRHPIMRSRVRPRRCRHS